MSHVSCSVKSSSKTVVLFPLEVAQKWHSEILVHHQTEKSSQGFIFICRTGIEIDYFLSLSYILFSRKVTCYCWKI